MEMGRLWVRGIGWRWVLNHEKGKRKYFILAKEEENISFWLRKKKGKEREEGRLAWGGR
jgi:hypothetical protein